MSFEEITNSCDLELLKDMKEKLKSQVVGDITWENRMHLYKQIQLINEQIKSLEPMEVS